MKIRMTCALFLIGAFAAQANAAIMIGNVNTDGTVPDSSINYTISTSGVTARAIFFPGSSDTGVWSWDDSFPEFLDNTFGGAASITVNFDAPLPINRLVLGPNSISPDGSAVHATLSVSGGTATTADFNLTDGVTVLTSNTGPASYNGATGEFTADALHQSLMIGSTSAKTLTSFTLTGYNNVSDAYTLFFGFTDTAPTARRQPSKLQRECKAGWTPASEPCRCPAKFGSTAHPLWELRLHLNQRNSWAARFIRPLAFLTRPAWRT